MLALLGLVAAASVPGNIMPGLGLGAGWAVLVVVHLVRQRRRSTAIEAYRLYPDGSVDLLDRAGSAGAGRLLPGSVLYERIGWLRFEAAGKDGSWAELIVGNARKSDEWRRLQVIFRHRTA